MCIGAEGCNGDHLRVAVKGEQVLAGLGIPNFESLVLTAADDPALRLQGNGKPAGGVPLNRAAAPRWFARNEEDDCLLNRPGL